MSGPAASVRKRETRARRESIESLSADKKIARRERKAAWNRKDRAEKKVEQSLVGDEIARLQAALTRKDRRIAALTQLLDCIDEQARGDSDADHEPDQADEVDLANDGDQEDEEEANIGGWSEREAQSEYERVFGRPRVFKSLTGLTADGFEKLLELSHPKINSTNFHGNRKEREQTEQNMRLTVRLQLWATLYWLRVYPTMTVASSFLKIPVMYLKKVITRVVSALSDLAESVGRVEGGLAWPTKEELAAIRSEQANIKLPGIAPDYAIDGMHIRIQNPSKLDAEKRKAYWNGKHKCWCLMVIVVTDLRGRPVYMSDPLPGGEWRVVLNLDIKGKCKETGAAIVGDALYAFNRASDKAADSIQSYFTLGPTSVTRLRAIVGDEELDAEMRELARAELRSTKAASRLRVVVENTIARMRHWAVLTRDSPFRHYVPPGFDMPKYYLDIVKVARVAAFLASRAMIATAPRAADWRPQDDDKTAKYGYYGAPLNAKNVEMRVRALFKKLGPKKKVQVDGEDAEDDSVEFNDNDKDGKVDWSKYEVDGDFIIQPQRITTARQTKNAQTAVDGAKITHARVDYDALDRAEGQRTTSSRWKTTPKKNTTKK
jgi:hypothetical protein